MNVQDLNSIFGRNIRFYRNMRRWSQEELAEKMDVSKNTICEIETGKKFVRAERLVQFADIFNTDIYKFFMPEEVLRNDTTGLLAKFGEEVKDRVTDMIDEYMQKIRN